VTAVLLLALLPLAAENSYHPNFTGASVNFFTGSVTRKEKGGAGRPFLIPQRGRNNEEDETNCIIDHSYCLPSMPVPFNRQLAFVLWYYRMRAKVVLAA
jgi:hypothetical protein